MGHIQTKDYLHMGNNPLRHFALMGGNKPTTDIPDGESDQFGPKLLCILSVHCELNFPQKRRYQHVQVQACRGMPLHAAAQVTFSMDHICLASTTLPSLRSSCQHQWKESTGGRHLHRHCLPLSPAVVPSHL